MGQQRQKLERDSVVKKHQDYFIALERSGTPSRHSRGIDTPVAIISTEASALFQKLLRNATSWTLPKAY